MAGLRSLGMIRVFTALALLALAALPVMAAEAPPPFTTTLGRQHPLAGTLWRPAAQAFATPEDLVAAARQADVVLLGETHDNPDHHALQAWVLRRLLADGRRPLLAFEMIDADQAPKLAAWLAPHPTDAAGLGPALEWERSGWPDWAMYRPIAQAALTAGIPLSAANISRETTRAIVREGLVPDLPPLAAASEEAMRAEIHDDHCGMLPDSVLPAMVRVQRARDAAMARAVSGHGPAVLIAGSGHVRADRGVPTYLPAGTRSLSVAFVEVDEAATAPDQYDHLPYDFVWFTPRAERTDPCEQMRAHMKRKK